VGSPIKVDSHFFWLIFLKLAGNLKNGKNRIPLFFFFEMKINEDIRYQICTSFLTAYVYSDIDFRHIFTEYRSRSVESKSVEIFGLSFTVFELKAI
jgi:hypothetical protein